MMCMYYGKHWHVGTSAITRLQKSVLGTSQDSPSFCTCECTMSQITIVAGLQSLCLCLGSFDVSGDNIVHVHYTAHP